MQPYLTILFSFLKKFYLCISFWLLWAFIAVCGLSVVVVSGGSSSLWSVDFSLLWLLLLQLLGSRVHRLICSKACEIFPDQGLNQCPLYCKVDS